MEMLTISSGNLRAIGYDTRERILQVQLNDGRTLQYNGVGEEIWRRLKHAGSPWSFYRDNIEEEFAVKTVSGKAPPANKNPLDRVCPVFCAKQPLHVTSWEVSFGREASVWHKAKYWPLWVKILAGQVGCDSVVARKRFRNIRGGGGE